MKIFKLLRISLYFCFLVLIASAGYAQSPRDGQLFDQGLLMEEPSPRAHESIRDMMDYLGHWDVSITLYPTDTTEFNAEAASEVTFMNRGYGFMERLHASVFEEAGRETNSIYFLNFDPTNEVWVMGEASSYTERVTLYNGHLEDDAMTLSTALRRNGGVLLTWMRVTYRFRNQDAFEVREETSIDGGASWKLDKIRSYERRDDIHPSLIPRTDYGLPSPDRPKETAEFDFLLGQWDAAHEILFGGNWVKFPTQTTAVHALNGYAILEHSWYNVDPSLPDAATTIVRLYNRSMRRWECLYIDNRSNSMLYFGGRQEGDEIVLHNFVADATSPIPRYVFYDIEPDSYSWYAESSADRGASFNKTWEIRVTRQNAGE